jgi:hypothetical protein
VYIIPKVWYKGLMNLPRFLIQPSRLSLIAFIFIFLPCFGQSDEGTVLLFNDTPYHLNATLLAADGTVLGQVSLKAGQQTNFTKDLLPTRYQLPMNPDTSLTPYTVIWKCHTEGIYAIGSNVSPGSLVRATLCDGQKFCPPPKPQTPPNPQSGK